MNRIGGAGTDIGQELPDPPWPVAARDLLTQRERSLYQSLLALYPEHKIFVQVALSQLIDVPEDHPERKSIRNRFSQLVADFVLCRSNLSVVAVIELDDRSHERADRQAADVRKNKALSDAGLRLVRIPAGTLPSEERLREIIDADHAFGGSANEATRDRRFMPAESGIELAEDWGSAGPDHMVGSPDSRDLELRSWKWSAIKAGLAGVTLIGGWFLYGQFLLVMAHRALQPLAVPHVTATSPSSTTTPLAPSRIPVASVAVGLSAEDLAERKRTELQAATAAKQQKDLAWAAYYSAPASCEHPTDWTAQVECGNQYMRAKRQFEKQWVALHGTVPGIVGAVVLDDASIGAARR